MSQLTFENSGELIRTTTFVVLDCETTGVDSVNGSMTELAAIKICGGEVLGTFQTLINPGQHVDARIVSLTGITNEELRDAPPVEVILPSFLEFLGDAIIIGHNVRFDIGFLNAALTKHSYPKLPNAFLDTLSLAKKLIPGEVPNFKLSTLAHYCKAEVAPTHRAFADVQATIDLFHYLVGRSSALGVKGIHDLFTLPSPMRRERFLKRSLAKDAPSTPGVYLFVSSDDEVLYVGMSRNIKKRLPQYFTTDDRSRIGTLLRETHHLEYISTPTAFEARVAELRLLAHLDPIHNVADTYVQRPYFVCCDPTEAAPTFRVRTGKYQSRECVFGPFTSKRSAQEFCETLQHIFSLRTCSKKCAIGKSSVTSECLNSVRGLHSCFCADDWSAERAYDDRVRDVCENYADNYPSYAQRLLSEMKQHSDDLRFEKAKTVHDFAVSSQKWMHRFGSIAQAAHVCVDESKEEPRVIHGRAIVRGKHKTEHHIAQSALEIIDTINMEIKVDSDVVDISQCAAYGLSYVSSPEQLRERYYTATFLARKNFLMTPLHIETHNTVASDHKKISATTIL